MYHVISEFSERICVIALQNIKMLTKNVDKCLSANPDFIYDEACLDFVTDRKVNILAQYLECKNCSYQTWFRSDGLKNSTSFLVNTKYQLQFKAEYDNTTCM